MLKKIASLLLLVALAGSWYSIENNPSFSRYKHILETTLRKSVVIISNQIQSLWHGINTQCSYSHSEVENSFLSEGEAKDLQLFS